MPTTPNKRIRDLVEEFKKSYKGILSDEIIEKHAEDYTKSLKQLEKEVREDEGEKLKEVKRDLVARMNHEDYKDCYVCDETLHHLNSLNQNNENK